MTAAALTSTEAALRAVTTVRHEDAASLIDRLPAEGALSWVRHGEGLVGWGEAARLEVSGPDALAEAAAWWSDWTADAEVDDAVGLPGTGPVLFASIAFDPAAGTSVFVIPEVVVGRRDGVGWVTTVDGAGPLELPPVESLPDGPSPPDIRGRSPSQRLKCRCAPLPVSGPTCGANDVTSPCRRATARTVWRTTIAASAAPTGSRGAIDISN